MATGTATRRHRFQPYRFAEHGLALSPARCVLDGERAIAAAPDVERHLLDLSAHRFRTARLSIDVAVSPSLLASVFPPDEAGAAPARVALVLRCPSTRVRLAQAVAEPPLTPGTYTAAVELERARLWGAVELASVLVRTSARPERGDGFAAFAGARVADSTPWEIRVDAVQAVRGLYLDIRYEDFGKAGVDQFPSPDALYQLDCDGEAPILWLNSAHERVATSLDSAASVGRVARLRDVLFERIQHAVWTRLFVAAARDAIRIGEPAFEWQEPVLRMWLPRLYPGSGDNESRLASLEHEMEEDGLAGLLGRLDGLLQEEHGTARAFDLLAEEIES
ncbi:MAG TPA: hypothetical protein VEL05_00570 [Candidatus Acidoferrum sp.]|nr:hypothetical protein [Candidatus Acidoferrum sp.]